MRWLRTCVRLLAPISLLFVVGCAFIDSSVSPRVGDINFGYDQATNDSILTNIVRSSFDQPLTFVTLSKVSGSQQLTSSNGLPTFTLGPHLSLAQHQFAFGPNSLSNQAAGNFDVGPLSTDRDFTKGLLDDMSLPELDLLIKQGISRDLILMLAIDGFEYQKDGAKRYLANDPVDAAQYCDFRFAVKALLVHGFTTESRLHKNKLYDKDDKTANFPRIVTEGRFCFDKNSTKKIFTTQIITMV